MADSVTVTRVFDGLKRKIFRFTNIGDGTGEAAVNKIDISTLLYAGNRVPSSLSIDMIDYNIQGFASVRLHWDHTTDDVIAVLPAGSGTLYNQGFGSVHDPKTAGGTGDILLTTNGGAAGATYDITVYCRPKG